MCSGLRREVPLTGRPYGILTVRCAILTLSRGAQEMQWPPVGGRGYGWPMTSPAIEAIDLVKRFGDFTAVDGVSFSVPQGTVLGLLGPNGAGKTTTVRMMTTLSLPTSGSARVAGYDVLTEPDMVRRNMGLT